MTDYNHPCEILADLQGIQELNGSIVWITGFECKKDSYLMIREAVGSDKVEIERLYRLLIPNNNNIQILKERIDQNQGRSPQLFVPYALLENIIVDPEAQGKGVGRKLFSHVEELCREEDCTKMMLLSNSQRLDAHRFFEQNGFSGTVSKGFKKYLV